MSKRAASEPSVGNAAEQSHRGTAAGRSPLDEMQRLTDDLARTLDRAVAVDNPQLEFIAASAQVGAIDSRRVDAIIHRTPPPEPMPWIFSHGIETARGPVRLPANAEYEMLARVCVPMRAEGQLLGYLWLFDEPSLGDDELDAAVTTAREIAQVLHRYHAGLLSEIDELTRLAGQLLRSTGGQAALADAVAAGRLPRDGDLTVLTAAVRGTTSGPSPTASDPAAALLGELARASLPLVARVDGGTLSMVTRTSSPADVDRVTTEIARRAAIASVSLAPLSAAPVAPDLDVAEARRRARYAADLRECLGWDDAPVTWQQLGTWRLLYPNAPTIESARELSPDASALLDAATVDQLQTLLVYFDTGRSIQATCARLQIHRGTAHYRLDRIRGIIGDDALDDGWRAVSLHVALRLWWALRVPH